MRSNFKFSEERREISEGRKIFENIFFKRFSFSERAQKIFLRGRRAQKIFSLLNFKKFEGPPQKYFLLDPQENFRRAGPAEQPAPPFLYILRDRGGKANTNHREARLSSSSSISLLSFV